jgi:hypothetical protein
MEEYLEIIYLHYPKNIYVSDLAYATTVENIRFWELVNVSRQNSQEFEGLSEFVGKRYNSYVMNRSLCGLFDLSYKLVFAIPKNYGIENYTQCVLNIGVLAKYYSIYLTQNYDRGQNSLKIGAEKINEKEIISQLEDYIEGFYPGYKPFPMEYYHETVPRVYSSKRPLENATYFECLMTDHIL